MGIEQFMMLEFSSMQKCREFSVISLSIGHLLDQNLCPRLFFSFLGCSGFVGSFGSFPELGALYPFVLCCALMGF
jgi:hypothetical protein